jgi:hypothetical protein
VAINKPWADARQHISVGQVEWISNLASPNGESIVGYKKREVYYAELSFVQD